MPIAQVNGIELYYEEEGSGDPLVLIMGLSAQHLWWSRKLIDRFKAEGFRVIRFDNRDVGKSTRLDALGEPNVRVMTASRLMGRRVKPPYTLNDLVADTVGLMDFLDIPRAHVLGGSMGGMVAQRVALAHPSRVSSLSLLFTNSGSRRDGFAAPSALKMLLRRPPQGREETIEALAEVGRVLTGPVYSYDGAYWRDLAARCWDHSDVPPGRARQMAAVLGTPTTRHRLHEIKQPTLVMHGTLDLVVRPKGSLNLARLIPRSQLILFNGMGHHIPPELRETLVLNVRAVANAADRASSA